MSSNKTAAIDHLRDCGLGEQVDAALKKKVVWPFPSQGDETFDEASDAQVKECVAMCKAAKYRLWGSKGDKKRKEQWDLQGGKYFIQSSRFLYLVLLRCGSYGRRFGRE